MAGPEPTSTRSPGGRIPGLDGLRGVAAVVVVAFHWVAAVRPTLIYGTADHGPPGDDGWARSPWFVLYNGSFAVFVFFAMSGLVLAAAATRSARPFPSLVFRRYVRLAVPTLAATVVAWGLFRWQPHAGAEYVARRPVSAWGGSYRLLDRYEHVSRRPLDAATEPLWRVFVRGGSVWNEALWTMRVELAGSIAIYLLYRAVVPSWRWLPLAAGGCLLAGGPNGWWSNGLAFAGGAGLFEAYARGWLSHWRGLAQLPAALLVAAGLFLGGLPRVGSAGTWLFPLDAFLQARVRTSFELIESAGAVFLVAGVLTCRPVTSLLDRGLCHHLGRISFSLYLVHLPLLATLFAWTGDRLADRGVRFPTALATATFVAAAFATTTALTAGVDRPLMRWMDTSRRRRPSAGRGTA